MLGVVQVRYRYRDLNAAKNILAAGRAERQDACGDGVRPRLAAVVAETGTHRSAA
jgi:putative transposase